MVKVLDLLARVVDPEIPTLNISELGILRGVESVGERVVVTVTPTYSGCPAMDWIKTEIRRVLEKAGVSEVEVRTTYFPPWSSAWISEVGRRKLAEAGIAPPDEFERAGCPHCGATTPRVVSEFGSTACKALMVCASCGEPFHLFKEL
jgi:ring-1,2-phenylacetyl-CoA epoxidase subunit PaaD